MYHYADYMREFSISTHTSTHLLQGVLCAKQELLITEPHPQLCENTLGVDEIYRT